MALRRILNTRHYKLITPIDTPGIYHNSDLGLISLSSDGSNWVTIADKNLGATQVYNDGDTLSEANCGKYYQRGNNYGFPFTGATTTSSTQVNASTYGPGNYYSSSTFIDGNDHWETSNNKNLWGGETGTVEAMRGPCDEGYHIPSSTEWDTIIGILVTTFGLPKNNTTAAYLKLPMAGKRRYYDGNTLDDQGTRGYYWASNADANIGYAHHTTFFSSNFVEMIYYRGWGVSIRPFKNEAVEPDDSRTKLY